MAAFANRLTDTARRLLTKYGQSIHVVREIEDSFNPETGEVILDDASLEYNGVGYPANYSMYYQTQHLTQQGDIQLIFSSTTRPLNGDIFTVNAKDYTALSVQNITTQGVYVIYKIQLRQ